MFHRLLQQLNNKVVTTSTTKTITTITSRDVRKSIILYNKRLLSRRKRNWNEKNAPYCEYFRRSYYNNDNNNYNDDGRRTNPYSDTITAKMIMKHEFFSFQQSMSLLQSNIIHFEQQQQQIMAATKRWHCTTSLTTKRNTQSFFHCFQKNHRNKYHERKRSLIQFRSFVSTRIKQQQNRGGGGVINTTDDQKTSGNNNSNNNNNSKYISILNNPELIEQIPIEDVRNFCFIAHVDHGKSSLSMRVLELTGNLGDSVQQTAWKAAAMTASTATTATATISTNELFEDGISTSTLSTKTDTSVSDNLKTASSSTLSSNKEQIDVLDSLAVEQQRGITVKTSTATMLYRHKSAIGPTGVLLLNMYDTPGHVDFGKEVTRALQFVQGAVLLLDATQGIQAQTWSVYEKAKSIQPKPPELLMALTKIDLESARPIHVSLSVAEFFHWDDPDTIIHTSARNRIGIKPLLDAVCEHVPSPTPLADDDVTNPCLRGQVVDSWYDTRGVNCLVRIVSGQLKEGDRISIVAPSETISSSLSDKVTSPSSTTTSTTKDQQTSYPVQEVGILLPKAHRTGKLIRGQMGYVRFGLRDPRQAMPGTVLIYNTHANNKTMILPQIPLGISSAKSVLYASVHPRDVDEFEDLCNAVDRLALNDTGLEVSKTASIGDGSGTSGGPFLGPGLRVGFQGLLHVEVFRQRLQDEFDMDAVVTPPKVPYTIMIHPSKSNNLKESITKVIEDLSEWPDPGTKYKVYEPIVDARIIARVEDAGSVMDLITRKRGYEINTKPIDEEKWLFTAKLPWAEVVTDFHDQLKTVTSGFGSLDTSESDPPVVEGNLCKIDIHLNGEAVDALSFVCHKDSAQSEGRSVCSKLQAVLPRQQFVTVIQAKSDAKIIASERIKAYRKDVLTKSGKTVGGGDQTRKMKLLEKQKKGKKRMQDSGRVSLSQEAFNSVISRTS